MYQNDTTPTTIATTDINTTHGRQFDPDKYVLVTDLDRAKKEIADMLRDLTSIDVLAEIILYNTDTYRRFFWRHSCSPDFECWNCRSRWLEENGYDCVGEGCLLCPHFSFIPEGFNKFSECTPVEGMIWEFDEAKFDELFFPSEGKI